MKLLKLVCVDVVFSTHQGYFKQVDGVAMGSPLGPLLANVFMSKFDKDLGLFSPFYYRYVDDILRTMLVGGGEYLLNFANTMHPFLKFTLESEDIQGGLSFLDMRVEHVGNKIEASWYTKKTDTGVGSGTFRHQPFGRQYGLRHMGDKSVDQMGSSN